MPSLAHHRFTMAHENAWANHRLLAACTKLTVAIVLSTLAGCRTVTAPLPDTFVCAHCGQAMVVLQVFVRNCSIRAPPPT